MHPVWQIKQIITVNGQRYVNRNLSFSSSGLPGIFISFNSLVAWIVKNVKSISFILDYVDDSSGCNLQGDTAFYPPYARELPIDQCCMLLLWDELGIPHKEHKQIHGAPLIIIGIDVDPNWMTLCLPETHLLSELHYWASKPPKSSSGSFKLKYWERLTGWFNWALNMYHLLHPALNNIYAKMIGKRNRIQCIYINNAIQDDLLWAITHIESSDGIDLFKSRHWIPSMADYVIYCDACPNGMGFWYLASKDRYYAPTPVNVPSNVIFYFKCLCVVSAIINVQARTPHGSKILIYTDNSNTVDIFQTLCCLPHNQLLKSAINILIKNDYSLCVLHVPGEQNIITDVLSHVKFLIALNIEPDLKLDSFNPPNQVGSSK